MMPSAMPCQPCLLALLPLLAFLAPLPGLAQQVPTISDQQQARAQPRAGEGGDAVLPAGYKSVVWGASPEIVQGIRGRVMESQPSPDPHIAYLIDVPPPAWTDDSEQAQPSPAGSSGDSEATEQREVVKWKLWDGRLIEVHVHYEGPFTRKEGRDLVGMFQRRYGEGSHEVTLGATSPNHPTPPVIEEWWTWEDPFTVQILKRIAEDESWVVIRSSRVLDLARRAQDEREREEVRTQRVQQIDLD